MHIAKFHRLPLAMGLVALLNACTSSVETGPIDDLEPDPVVLDVPMAYIDRPLPVDEDDNPIEDDVLMPQTFMAGAVLYLKDRASSSAAQVDITSQAWPEGELYDVKDLTASYDGERLLFAMRAPNIEGADEEDQPRWNIWEYDIPSATLRRVIADDIQAEVGHDVAPRYLPGVERKIVFSSNRQTRSRAILLDDSKPQYSALDDSRNEEAFVLHVMDNDGTNIQQLTYNQSHEMSPLVMPDGRIIYTRWDRVGGNNQLSFYTIDPYGMHQALQYGYHSQDTGTGGSDAVLVRPQAMPDGRVFGINRARISQRFGGDLVAVDVTNFVSATQPVNGGTGTEGQVSVFPLPLTTDDSPALAGSYYSAQPLFDATNRYLVSWSRCRVLNPDTGLPVSCTEDNLAAADVQLADPLFGVYIFNADEQTQQPILLPTEGRMLVEPLLLIPRTPDNLIPPPVADIDYDAALAEEGLGSLYIKSVYDFDGTASLAIESVRNPASPEFAARPARFLRLVKAVSIPSDEVLDFPNTAFGRSAANGMREILGYVPIEPDGSVMTKVPADVAFTFDIVDVNGQRLNAGLRHNNWLQVRPGEKRTCNGCHTRQSELPHGRIDAEAPSANAGAPTDGVFPNTNPLLPALMGETMAEAYTRVNGGDVRTPSVNIEYTDEWTDPMVTAPEADFSYAYSEVPASPDNANCGLKGSPWNGLCRVTIHYVDHIQPIWDLARPDAVDPMIDNQCSGCHRATDDMGVLIDPDDRGQLELTADPDPQQQAHFVSYRELLFNDVIQEINENNQLVDKLFPVFDANGNPVYLVERDANGDPILDENGNPILILDENGMPIQETETRNIPASMSSNGAANSNRFMNKFTQAPGTNDTVDHRGMLKPGELKLLREWLDLGAQYYNNPFAVPVN
ncbi:hypothetical protein [Simiduia agarivorans]|uniref:Hydrazine synthase alpha subunit middle domain-containing protein n=1 Tax=Simiduia agarivorans (strain DSM 21679 / JCM 13881 / BCRC 17597 / SA1) TaxID=1117647 RepID=K4L0A5_SIMAS|nr:hypothetical protein [Simiduia agarivorans]AFU99597.1 hypothetical protein M5M_12185 [Simiduia agarivorans SA1 = DSM 21679]